MILNPFLRKILILLIFSIFGNFGWKMDFLVYNLFLRKIHILLIFAIFGHFWLKNTLSCILLNIGTLFFLIFCMKLETIKGYNLTLHPFLRKILILQIFAIFGHFWLKMDFLVYCSILTHYIFSDLFSFFLFFSVFCLYYFFLFLFFIVFLFCFLFQRYRGSFFLCLFLLYFYFILFFNGK